MRLPFHSYELDSGSTSRLVNCYAEPGPQGGSYPIILTRAPGIVEICDTDDTFGAGALHDTFGVNRRVWGMHRAFGKLWAMLENTLISVSKSGHVDYGSGTGLPGMIRADTHVDIASNTDTLVVVSAPHAFTRTNDGTQAAITDADLPDVGDVEFLDNYLLFREERSGRFVGADLGSATDFDALNFATAETDPDNLVGMKADHGQLLLLGEETCELWENTGVSGFPFERNVNGRIEIGCASGRTAQKHDQSINWLANDHTVRRLEGITPRRISTHAIEQKVNDNNAATAYASSYTQGGHIFYVLYLADGTYVYDATTGLWHERETYGEANWKPSYHTNAYGKTYVAKGTKIGYLDPDTYTEFGETQVMSWTYQPVYAKGRRAFHDRLEIVMETGVGTTTGGAPEIMLEFSDDGGKTYQSLPAKTFGAKGEYQERVIWTGLGSAEQRVYRCSISDPVPVSILDTVLVARGGRL